MVAIDSWPLDLPLPLAVIFAVVAKVGAGFRPHIRDQPREALLAPEVCPPLPGARTQHEKQHPQIEVEERELELMHRRGEEESAGEWPSCAARNASLRMEMRELERVHLFLALRILRNWKPVASMAAQSG